LVRTGTTSYFKISTILNKETWETTQTLSKVADSERTTGYADETSLQELYGNSKSYTEEEK
jgi:hypothetical protein